MKKPYFVDNLKEAIKKRWWYIFLVIISSIYVLVYRNDIYQMTELNAKNLIFILWLILLILPLFSEIEIGSVKLKKEIEQTRADVKESVGELKHQILDLKISNNNAMYVYNYQPLPSRDELSQLQMNIKPEDNEHIIRWKILLCWFYCFRFWWKLWRWQNCCCKKTCKIWCRDKNF